MVRICRNYAANTPSSPCFREIDSSTSCQRVRRYPYPHPVAAGTIGEIVSCVGSALLRGKGVACAEIVDRATKPANVPMMVHN
jgi:hypothetical protein